ncbi:MAG: tetratricopeptide repeat protein [Xanthobacteraceae bacterium]
MTGSLTNRATPSAMPAQGASPFLPVPVPAAVDADKLPASIGGSMLRAADQGLPPAQFRLGGLYEKGIGVKKDLAQARDLYTAAADKGNGKAMHNLAELYAEGINGPADYKTAAHWFRKAADRGITDSQYNLAILYARGIGVEQNYAESYKWFTLAANRGDADAGKKRDEIASIPTRNRSKQRRPPRRNGPRPRSRTTRST